MKKAWSIARKIILEILIWLLSLVVLVPFFLVLINSLKTKAEANLMDFQLPMIFQWENYSYVFEKSNLIRAFFNSMLISSVSVFISTIFSALAAFVFSRNRNKINKVLYGILLLGLVLPLNMMPTIKVLKTIGLMGSYAGIILLFAALMIPLSVFLYYGFIKSIPKSLDEAALIDGASGLKLFFKIIFPLLKPVTITVVVLNFMSSWNDFQIPLYILNDSDKWGMILSVYSYFGTYISSWNLVFTVITLALIPVVAVYVIGQKYIISGMIAGAIKE